MLFYIVIGLVKSPVSKHLEVQISEIVNVGFHNQLVSRFIGLLNSLVQRIDIFLQEMNRA